MSKKAWINKRFDGGWSTDEQLGIPNSFPYSQHIDFRKKPSQLTVLPTTRKESAGVVVDLLQNMVMANNGIIYSLGSNGYFYKRTTAGAWSSEAKLDNGAFGLSYRTDVDKIFATSQKTVSEYSPVSGSPTIKVNKFAASASTTAVVSGGAETYTLKTAITENSTDLQSFESDIEPLSSIKVKVVSKGTGDWTLTLHDAANNTLATSTVTNANLNDNALNSFAFTSQVRLYVKPNARTYHFHLTSTVADGTVNCSTAGDFNTCDYEIYADRLIETNNGMHPIQTFLQYECIGNGNYLSVWEPLSEDPSNLEWLRHKLTFPSGLEVCGLAVWNEYLAIACEKRTTGDNSPQTGYIFFWDGLSSTYNYFMAIPEGSPYSIHEHKNVLFYEAGGAWFAYGGGEPVKIRTMPSTDTEYSGVSDTTVVYPNMATVRRGIHLLGYPSVSSNTGIDYGVYSWGAIDKNFPESFGYSYTMSTGSTNVTAGNTDDLAIGMVKNYGDKLFISWRDDSQSNPYGVDIVDNSSTPFQTATWESLVYEDELPTKTKTALYIEVGFETLPAGATVTPKYRLSRNGAWVLGNTVSSGDVARFDLNIRFYEIQLGLDLTATSLTPTITSITLVYDDNSREALS